MFQLLKSIIPYIPVILALIRFILDETRYQRKRKQEIRGTYRKQLESAQHEKGAYPPRKDKHQR
ncbi:hypothetical protein EBB07_29400 [Paenibacillaceae bacterium]|nr:hypothetical protein EBB07_29400 [Paenibacillaceae bacterium]